MIIFHTIVLKFEQFKLFVAGLNFFYSSIKYHTVPFDISSSSEYLSLPLNFFQKSHISQLRTVEHFLYLCIFLTANILVVCQNCSLSPSTILRPRWPFPVNSILTHRIGRIILCDNGSNFLTPGSKKHSFSYRDQLSEKRWSYRNIKNFLKYNDVCSI